MAWLVQPLSRISQFIAESDDLKSIRPIQISQLDNQKTHPQPGISHYLVLATNSDFDCESQLIQNF